MNRHSYFFIILTLVLPAAPSGQTPTPTPSAAVLPEDLQAVPSIAPNYRSESRTLPDLGRIGVDAARQRTLTLGQAIELTLVNNRDIEVTRKTAEMAEFDLRAARGFYQPRLTGQSFYERSTVANVSIFSNNPETTQSSIVGNAALQFFAPSQGTVFTGGFNNTRLSTDNPISILSPQYNSSLSFSVTQPLFRGRRFDQPRRIIEIARRNIELSDTQFRSRTIESVAAVQRTYWDLTFALRNLQVQRDGLRDAKAQLEHNRR